MQPDCGERPFSKAKVSGGGNDYVNDWDGGRLGMAGSVAPDQGPFQNVEHYCAAHQPPSTQRGCVDGWGWRAECCGCYSSRTGLDTTRTYGQGLVLDGMSTGVR